MTRQPSRLSPRAPSVAVLTVIAVLSTAIPAVVPASATAGPGVELAARSLNGLFEARRAKLASLSRERAVAILASDASRALKVQVLREAEPKEAMPWLNALTTELFHREDVGESAIDALVDAASTLFAKHRQALSNDPEFVYWFATLAASNGADLTMVRKLQEGLSERPERWVKAWGMVTDASLAPERKNEALFEDGVPGLANLIGVLHRARGGRLAPRVELYRVHARDGCGPELLRTADVVLSKGASLGRLAPFVGLCREVRAKSAAGGVLAEPVDVSPPDKEIGYEGSRLPAGTRVLSSAAIESIIAEATRRMGRILSDPGSAQVTKTTILGADEKKSIRWKLFEGFSSALPVLNVTSVGGRKLGSKTTACKEAVIVGESKAMSHSLSDGPAACARPAPFFDSSRETSVEFEFGQLGSAGEMSLGLLRELNIQALRRARTRGVWLGIDSAGGDIGHVAIVLSKKSSGNTVEHALRFDAHGGIEWDTRISPTFDSTTSLLPPAHPAHERARRELDRDVTALLRDRRVQPLSDDVMTGMEEFMEFLGAEMENLSAGAANLPSYELKEGTGRKVEGNK